MKTGAASALAREKRDKDWNRMASFLSSTSSRPLEMGTFAHFLAAVLNNPVKATKATTSSAFIDFANTLLNPLFFLDYRNLCQNLRIIVSDYRNKAAHTSILPFSSATSLISLLLKGDKHTAGFLVRLVAACK